MRAEQGQLTKEVETLPPQDVEKRETFTKLSVDADIVLREHQARLQNCLDTWSSRQEEMLTRWSSQLEKVEKALGRHAHFQDKHSTHEAPAAIGPQAGPPPSGGLHGSQEVVSIKVPQVGHPSPGGPHGSLAHQACASRLQAGTRVSIAQQVHAALPGAALPGAGTQQDHDAQNSQVATHQPPAGFFSPPTGIVALTGPVRKNSKRKSKAVSPGQSGRSSTACPHVQRYSNFTASKMHEDALFERTKSRASEATQGRTSRQLPQRQGSLLAPYSVVSGVPKVVDPIQPSTQDKEHKKALSRIVSGVKASIRASMGVKAALATNHEEDDEEDSEAPLHDLHCLEVIRTSIQSLTFDVLCGTLIFLNAALIGVETDFMVDKRDHDGGFFALQMIFNVWYLLELTLRVWADRFRFFSSKDWKWNIFDMALVSISVMELLLEILNMRGFAVMGRLMRSIRILRVVRTLRIVRVLRYVREFRKMIFSIAASMQTLFWSLLLLGVMMYIFAVLFTQAVSQYKRDLEDNSLKAPADLDGLNDAFGSLSRSVYSLYMAISGGKNWGLVANPLMLLHWSFVLFFLTFITVCVFGVLNVVTSVFVESAMQSANHYRDLLIQEKMHDKEMYVKHMREVFRQIDRDGNDVVTYEEVEMFLTDSNLRMYLEALEIDLVETHSLFRLLDKDGSGFIDIDEFCEGCLRLKGDAKSFDIHCLLYENQRMLTKWTQFMDFVESEFYHLSTGNRWSAAHGDHSHGHRISTEPPGDRSHNKLKVAEEDYGDASHSLNPTSVRGSTEEGEEMSQRVSVHVNPYRFYPEHPKNVPGRVVLD